jgi:hypothetical protein
MSTNTPGPWAYGKALAFAGGLLTIHGVYEHIAHPANPARIEPARTASQPAAESGKASLRNGLVRLRHQTGPTIISL